MALKEMRKRAGLTARDVATAVGVSFQNVYNWEAGSYMPRAAQLLELAKLYDCTVDELLSSEQARPGEEDSTDEKAACRERDCKRLEEVLAMNFEE